jgi:transcriptional regulator with AAA-type ATPase domain
MFLPQELKDRIPDDIVGLIESFLPKPSKKKKALSPSLQRELEKLQKMNLKGMKSTYLREFDAFAL